MESQAEPCSYVVLIFLPNLSLNVLINMVLIKRKECTQLTSSRMRNADTKLIF